MKIVLIEKQFFLASSTELTLPVSFTLIARIFVHLSAFGKRNHSRCHLNIKIPSNQRKSLLFKLNNLLRFASLITCIILCARNANDVNQIIYAIKTSRWIVVKSSRETDSFRYEIFCFEIYNEINVDRDEFVLSFERFLMQHSLFKLTLSSICQYVLPNFYFRAQSL